MYGDQAMFVRRRVFEDLGGFPDVEILGVSRCKVRARAPT